MKVRNLSMCAALVVVGACGDSGTGPSRHEPRFRIVSGATGSDTIQALLNDLIVEVRDSTGALAEGIRVNFDAVPSSDSLRAHEATVQVALGSTNLFANSYSQTTDTAGRVRVAMRLGTVAGAAKLRISIASLGVSDTASYTVLHGQVAKLVLAVKDLTVPPNSSFSLGATGGDRFNNPVPGQTVIYSGGSTLVSVTQDGKVTTGPDIAFDSVFVTMAGLTQIVHVTVLPRMSFVASFGFPGGALRVARVQADGTGQQILTGTETGSLSPSAVQATSDVVFYTGDPFLESQVMIVTPGQNPRTLASGARFPRAAWPRFSPDGAWVYFANTRNADGGITDLWRIHPDGSGADSVGAFTPAIVNAAPAISPDGRTLAVDDTGGMRLIDVNTRAVRTTSAQCSAPRFSPDGTRIACIRDHGVSIVQADGTNMVTINSGFVGNLQDLSGVEWTPDGKWLLLHDLFEGNFFVRVSDGAHFSLQSLPVTYSQVFLVR